MDSWIVGGDFNNLETMEDQQGRGLEFVGIAQVEQSAWDSFLFAIGGRDSWRDLAFRRWQGGSLASDRSCRSAGRLREEAAESGPKKW